jgi:hypothetical protein
VDSRVPVGEGDQLLLAVGADPDDDQRADSILVQPDGEVHPVHPHVHIGAVTK